MTTATLRSGWTHDLPLADYLQVPAMSASLLEAFRRCPEHYRYALQAPCSPTSALERGTALHLAILEPGAFEGHYVPLGRCEGKRKDGERCAYRGSIYRDGQSFCKSHDPAKGEPPEPGVEVLAEADYASVLGMRDAVLRHPRAGSLFEGRGELEVTGVFEDPETGVLCKIRPDRLVERANLSANLKSTRDASPWVFGADAARRGYHRREAFYRRGLAALGTECTASALVTVESAPPYSVACYLIDEDHLRVAGTEVTRLLDHFKYCEAADYWPGYGDEFLTLRLPGWATRTEEDTDV